MITLSEIQRYVKTAREKGLLNKENYWAYFSLDDTGFMAFNTEHKTDGWRGYFVEDDARLMKIYPLAIKRLKIK